VEIVVMPDSEAIALARLGGTLTSITLDTTFHPAKSGPRVMGDLTVEGQVRSAHPSARLEIEAPVSISGDMSLTGPLALSADPTGALHAVTKQYADTKIGKAGDRMTGPLSISAAGIALKVDGNVAIGGDLIASNFFDGVAIKVAAGKTTRKNTDWKAYPPPTGTAGIVVTVDTSAARFTSTPLYICSLHGDGGHWATTGGTSVYGPSKSSFDIYLRYWDGSPLTPAAANGAGWHIQWIGIQLPGT
jgi:hypothetical protein